MRRTLKEYQNRMGWDNEEAIAILLDYISEIHHGWGKYNENKHLQEYLDDAVKEDMRVPL